MSEDEEERKMIEIQRKLKELNKVSGSLFGFSAIFTGIKNLLDIVNEMDRKGKSELKKSGELAFKDSKIVYGFSIKLGTDGITVDKFGNIDESERRPEVRDEREPLVDLLDETRGIRVFAELPGADERDIAINVEDSEMTIKTKKDVKYYKRIALPCKVRLIGSSYKNGVLEVILEKVL